MRRFVTFIVGALVVLAVVPAHAAAAGARVGPRLTLSFSDGSALTVSGRRCVPVEDAPTSVLVTADWRPGHVYTATPDATGHWSVDVPLPEPLDGSFTVRAECDDYFGTLTYPDAGFGVLATSAGPTPVSGHVKVPTDQPVASTGPRTALELALGLAALALGGLLVWAGRPRRRGLPGE